MGAKLPAVLNIHPYLADCDDIHPISPGGASRIGVARGELRWLGATAIYYLV